MQLRVKVTLVLFLLAVGVVMWLGLHPREPVYKGKRLSLWLEAYAPSAYGDGSVRSIARSAVKEAGTNAVPVLLRMLRARESGWSHVMRLLQKQHILKIRYIPPSDRVACAMAGFSFLGESASNAVPALVKMLGQGSPAPDQLNAAAALDFIGPGAKGAVPALLELTGSTNQMVRSYAWRALGFIHSEPELVVPVCLKAMRSADLFPASDTLAKLGPSGTSAIPELTRLLKDKDEGVRRRAAFAFWSIDHEKARNAGVITEEAWKR